jgi:hypothetical protein
MVLLGKYNVIWSQPMGVSVGLGIFSQTQGLFGIWNTAMSQSISVHIDGARIYDMESEYKIGGWFKHYRWEFIATDFTNGNLNGIVKFQHPDIIPGGQI